MENKIKEEIVLNSENVENKDEKKNTKKVFILLIMMKVCKKLCLNLKVKTMLL